MLIKDKNEMIFFLIYLAKKQKISKLISKLKGLLRLFKSTEVAKRKRKTQKERERGGQRDELYMKVALISTFFFSICVDPFTKISAV